MHEETVASLYWIAAIRHQRRARLGVSRGLAIALPTLIHERPRPVLLEQKVVSDRLQAQAPLDRSHPIHAGEDLCVKPKVKDRLLTE